jgi:hypothetical protein
MTNNDLQNTSHKTKDWTTRNSQKSGGELSKEITHDFIYKWCVFLVINMMPLCNNDNNNNNNNNNNNFLYVFYVDRKTQLV